MLRGVNMDLQFRYQLWLKVRYALGIVLFVVVLIASRKLLLWFGLDPILVNALGGFLAIGSAAVGWFAFEPLEKRLFGDQIVHEPLSRSFIVIAAALAVLVVAALTWEAYSSYEHETTQKNSDSYMSETRQLQREAEKSVSRQDMQRIEELRRQREEQKRKREQN